MDDSVLTFENGIENSNVITCGMTGHAYCLGDETNDRFKIKVHAGQVAFVVFVFVGAWQQWKHTKKQKQWERNGNMSEGYLTTTPSWMKHRNDKKQKTKVYMVLQDCCFCSFCF